MSPDSEHFSDDETKEIIRRALDLQRQQDGREPGGSLGLHDLEQLGSETGIPPELIRRAAEDVQDRRAVFQRSFWLGAAPVQVRDSEIPGTLDERTMNELATVINATSGKSGHGEPGANGFEWKTLLGLYRISIWPKGDGMLHLHVERRRRLLAVVVFAPILGAIGLGAGLGVGLGVGIGVLGSALFSALVPVGVFAASWILARSIYAHLGKTAFSRIQQVVRAIRETLGDRRASKPDAR